MLGQHLGVAAGSLAGGLGPNPAFVNNYLANLREIMSPPRISAPRLQSKSL